MKSLNIGTFNVRGLCDEKKKDNLAEDLAKYNVDVVCLQETKISEGTDCNIRNSRLITLKSTNKHHGNGFIVSSKWKENIHPVWKVSDRIAVLQLTTKTPEYASTHLGSSKIRISRNICYQSKLIQRKPRKKLVVANHESEHISGAKLIIRKTPTPPAPQTNTHHSSTQKSRNEKLRMHITKTKPRNIITIINVYAPQAQSIDDTNIFYEELDAAKKKVDKERTSGILLICGDFNASIGTAPGTSAGPCLGSFSRGTWNRSG
jgi:exonuclease III